MFQLHGSALIWAKWKSWISTLVFSMSTQGLYSVSQTSKVLCFGMMWCQTRDVRRLLQVWHDEDFSLKTAAQCLFSEQFGIQFSAGSEQVSQQFYVTARKANRTVLRQIGSAMSRRKQQCMSTTPLHPMLICHRNQCAVDGRDAVCQRAGEVGSEVQEAVGAAEATMLKGKERTRCPRFESLQDGLGRV